MFVMSPLPLASQSNSQLLVNKVVACCFDHPLSHAALGLSAGLATALEPEALEDLKWFLGESYASGLRVILSLWSHDILAVRK
jgi:hypothetical protein